MLPFIRVVFPSIMHCVVFPRNFDFNCKTIIATFVCPLIKLFNVNFMKCPSLIKANAQSGMITSKKTNFFT